MNWNDEKVHFSRTNDGSCVGTRTSVHVSLFLPKHINISFTFAYTCYKNIIATYFKRHKKNVKFIRTVKIVYDTLLQGVLASETTSFF